MYVFETFFKVFQFAKTAGLLGARFKRGPIERLAEISALPRPAAG